jgi:hypothetical protein
MLRSTLDMDADNFKAWLEANTQHANGPATEADMQQAATLFGARLPEGLCQVLSGFERPEGFLGESYIRFFDVPELLKCWQLAQEWAQGFVPFASDGGGELYGYDSRSKAPVFVLLPLVGMEWDVAIFLSETWDGFVSVVKSGKVFEKRYRKPSS